MTGQQTPLESAPTTVTYAVRDRVWADWIAEQLTKAGAKVRLDPWQPEYDDVPLPELIAQRAGAGGTALMVVTPHFLSVTGRSDQEWQSVLHLARDLRERFRPVLVGQEAVRPPENFWLMDPIRLYRVLDGAVARERLLRDLGLDAAAAARYPISEDQRRYPGNPPAVVNAELPHRNPAFTGRRGLLDRIRDTLTAPGPERKPVALGLHGLGGTGKTQLAIEYVHRFQNDYDLVWWIPARTRVSVRTYLKRLAVELGAVDVPEQETARDDLGEQVRFALRRLRQGEPHSRWLVVFDDVAEEAIADYLPLIPTSETGHVIITTRDQNWREHATEVRVDHFKRQESRLYLKRRTSRITDADAEALAAWAGDLPLALKQIGAIVDATGKPADELIELFRAEGLRALGESGDASYAYPVATTWLTARGLLEESYSHFAMHLLNTLAFFGGDPVPIAWFADAPEGVVDERVQQALRTPAVLEQSLRAIAAYSLAEDPGGSEPRLQMHQIVAQFVREELPPEDREEYLRQAQLVLAGADPGDPVDRQNFGVYASLLPHFTATRLAASPLEEVHELIANTIAYLHLRGEYETCLRVTESVIKEFTEGAPLEPWQFAVRRKHALALAGLGQFDAATKEDKTLFDNLMADPEASQDQVLEVASGLANGLRESGRYEDAARMERDVLSRRREIYADDPSHPEVLRARHNSAIDLRVVGDYAAAMEMDQETLRLRRERLGPDHYQTLLTESSVAGDLRASGRYAEAVALQESTYLATLDALGATSTHTFAAMIQLAICRRRAGQHQAAYDMAAEVHQHCADRYGENHPVTIAAATNLAGECRTLGLLEDGLRYAERAVASAQILYPETHVYRAACEANQATLLRALVTAGAPPRGRAPEEVLAEVLRTDLATAAVLADALGRDHASTLAVEVNVASDYAALGDHERAVAVGRRAYELLAGKRGREHPHTVAACVNLAADLEHVDVAEAAERRAWLEGLVNGDEAYRYPDLTQDGIDRRVICDLDLPMW